MGKVGVVPLAILLVFAGCCSNVVFLELTIKEDPTSGNILTFFQFLFIAMESGIFVTSFGLKKSHIPLRRYFILVGFFFVTSVLNNYSLRFSIPLPLHMIFRSGSLIANMILGVWLLKKSYSVAKYVAVVLITVGIVMATMASAQQIRSSSSEDDTQESGGIYRFAQLTIGISLLITALFATARMGIYQETLYKEFGKHPREAMFYMHGLPLPGFLLLAPDIWNIAVSFSASEPISLGFLSMPKLWLYVLGNSVTQYVCIRGVFVLTTECPSLVVTLVLTLRKFASLLFSIFYFQNPFTLQHWVATAMVFGGTALFAGVFQSIAELLGWLPTEKQSEIGIKDEKEDKVLQNNAARVKQD